MIALANLSFLLYSVWTLVIALLSFELGHRMGYLSGETHADEVTCAMLDAGLFDAERLDDERR